MGVIYRCQGCKTKTLIDGELVDSLLRAASTERKPDDQIDRRRSSRKPKEEETVPTMESQTE